MIRHWFQAGSILIAFILLGMPLQGQDRTTLLQKIEGVSGFEAVGAAKQYNQSTIEQFDPAISRDLRLYGLKSITVQQWKAAEGTARVTLFEMLDAPAAYGVYTLKRSTPGGGATPVLIGAASFRRGNQLYFWQSNYTVLIDGPAQLQDRLGQFLSRNILGRSQKPPVSEYLPATNLVEGTERYILSPEDIDRRLPVDPGQLGFDSSAEAATASYRIGGTRATLLLLLYPTQHLARKYADGLDASGKIPAAFRKRAGPLLAIVYGTTDDKAAGLFLEGINHQFKVTWNEPRPGLALGTMLITIFTFIGLALAFTTIVGVSFGGVRVLVKSLYPNRVFDRPETMEIIQLKLAQSLTDRQIGENSSFRGS